MQVFRAAALARTFGIAVAILWATVGVAAAQGTTGSIAGRVIDDSKAALPGATVTIREVETGQSRVLATDPQGRYRADALVPGKYAVTVELSGFRTAQYQDVSLSVGQAAVLDVQMQIGGITERVVVAGDATLVATRQSAVTALVDQSQIRELPLNGRDFTPVDAAPARRHLVSHHGAGGRSRHGHAGLGRRRPAEPDQLPGGRRGREHPGQRRARQRRRRHARRRHRARVPGARQQLQRRIRPQHRGNRRGRHALGHEQLHGIRLRVQPQQHVRLAHLLRRSDQVDSTRSSATSSAARSAGRSPATRRSSSAATKAFARRRG